MTVIIETDRDLKEQYLIKSDQIVAKLNNPESSIDYQFYEFLTRNNVSEFILKYQDTMIFPRNNGGYPNPTMNHLVLAKYLKENKKKSHSFVDLGCGTGFLGNFAKKDLGIDNIYFSDMNLNAINQSLSSYQLNNGVNLQNYLKENSNGKIIFDIKDKGNLVALIGDSNEMLNGFDLEGQIGTIAPMYVPEICEVFPQAYQVFASVAKNTGLKLYVAHSNLANDKVEEAAQKNGLSLNSVNEKEELFRIDYTDGRNRPIIKDLSSKGLKMKNGVPYHTIMVSEMSYR